MLSNSFDAPSSRYLSAPKTVCGVVRVDGPIDGNYADVGVQAPELRREFGQRSAASVVETAHEQHVDRPLDARRDRLHRRHATEAKPLGRYPDVVQRIDTLVADVQGQQTAMARLDGQAEPRGTRLLGVDADARRRRTLQVLA